MRTRLRLRKRTAVLGIAVVGMAGAVGAGFVVPASAGEPHTLAIEKVVVGTPPPGTTFTIAIDCTIAGSVQEVDFAAPGTQNIIVNAGPQNVCTVTEPGTGGAASVVFACEEDEGASECLSPTSINIFEPGTSGFTVTNTFDPSTPETPLTPATPVPGTPRFTG